MEANYFTILWWVLPYIDLLKESCFSEHQFPYLFNGDSNSYSLKMAVKVANFTKDGMELILLKQAETEES